jgi:hypothetical protein
MNAPPVLVVTHYDDLKEKGIVLMSGEVNGLSTQEAQNLMYQVQMFYGIDEAKFEFVKNFTERPDVFDYKALIDAVDKIN